MILKGSNGHIKLVGISREATPFPGIASIVFIGHFDLLPSCFALLKCTVITRTSKYCHHYAFLAILDFDSRREGDSDLSEGEGASTII
jgi:hypothetical protein